MPDRNLPVILYQLISKFVSVTILLPDKAKTIQNKTCWIKTGDTMLGLYNSLA